ncbi:MAG: DUF3298 domain-containing protein [Lachnospiraceae bacterium]|nr:DUF3298 domain-containing protein [Lachnospiraceae bacterium]
MKIYIRLFLLIIGCFICGCGKNEEVKVDSYIEETETSEKNQNYHVEKIEVLEKDSLGGIVAAYAYDLVMFDVNNPEYKQINQRLEELYEVYEESYKELFFEYVYSGRDSDYKTGDYPYYCTSKLKSIYEDKDYISVVMEEYWYAGGVSSTDIRAYNFHVKTGEVLYMDDVLGMQAANAKQYVINVIYSQLEFMNSRQEIMGIEAFLEELKVEDFKFYLDEEGMKVFFNTGEIASNAAGVLVFEVQ